MDHIFDEIYERKDYSGDADHVVDLPPRCWSWY